MLLIPFLKPLGAARNDGIERAMRKWIKKMDNPMRR